MRVPSKFILGVVGVAVYVVGFASGCQAPERHGNRPTPQESFAPVQEVEYHTFRTHKTILCLQTVATKVAIDCDWDHPLN